MFFCLQPILQKNYVVNGIAYWMNKYNLYNVGAHCNITDKELHSNVLEPTPRNWTGVKS